MSSTKPRIAIVAPGRPTTDVPFAEAVLKKVMVILC